MGEVRTDLKVLVPPYPETSPIPKSGITKVQHNLQDVNISRRGVAKTGLSSLLAVTSLNRGARNALRKAFHVGTPRLTPSQENAASASAAAISPENQAISRLSPYELMDGQNNANFDKLLVHGYNWVNAHGDKTTNGLPEVVVLELVPTELSLNNVGISLWEGVAKDAKYSTFPIDSDTNNPKRAAVVRVQGEKEYEIKGTGAETSTRYGFVSGEKDETTDTITYDFSLPTGEPLPEGTLPLFTTANFGNVIRSFPEDQ